MLLSHPPVQVAFAGLIALLVSYRHRGNVERLLAGTEDKIGADKELEEKAT